VEKESKATFSLVILSLIIVLLFTMIFSFGLGRYNISIGTIIKILLSKIITIKQDWKIEVELVLFGIRLPRILIAVLVGMGLSISGCVYQGVFQNPMASPNVLGTSSASALGAVLGILISLPENLVFSSAFIFGLFSIFLVYLIGSRFGDKQILSIILAGIMISSIFSASTSLIKLIADPNDKLPEITYWLMGGLGGSSYENLLFILVPLLIGFIPLFIFRWRLNILTLSEDEARSIGVNTSKLRILALFCATLITSSTVACCGVISWVGLVIPNLARKLVGNDYRKLFPISALMGGLFLLLVDDIARNLLVSEIPLGILTSFVGAPFFLYLMIRKGKKK